MLPLDHGLAIDHILRRAARMNISDHGLRFIALSEGMSSALYNDDGLPSSISEGNATIGFGHLVHYGPVDGRAEEAPYAGGISEAQALQLFREDIRSRERTVTDHTIVQLTQNQFDAMVSFEFNTGSYHRIAPVVNAGGDVCAAIAPYVLPAWASEGLTRRRRDECRLYNTPDEPAQEEPMTQQEKDAFTALVMAHADLQQQVTALANGTDTLFKGALRYLWALAAKKWPWPA